MKASWEGRPRQKQVSLQQVAISEVDEARKFLLTNLIETYLTMDTVEQEQLQQLLATPEATEARQMVSIYEMRGREEGRWEIILKLLRLKFGILPQHTVTNVQRLTEVELDTLAERVLSANSLQGMG